MEDKLTNYVMRKLQFKMVDFHTQIAKDRLHNVPESLVVVQKDNLSEAEFRDYIICVEKKLQKQYDTKRMQVLTKYHYIFKVMHKVDLPNGI